MNKLEPLSSSHCLHDDSRQKPASVPCKPLVRLLSICPRFACRYYRRIRSHRLRQQGSCSAVSCTCKFRKSPFCNVGGCCCQIFTFKALLQINRKYQHVDVGLTPIGDKLCVKVVDSVHVVHMSIYELRQFKTLHLHTYTPKKKFMANIAEMLPLRNLRAADRQQCALFQINAHSHLSNFLTPCETARTLSKTVNTASN